MQGGVRMIRLSGLRNRPVVCGNRQIGFLQNITLDLAQKRVQALIVSRGIRGKCVVYPEKILSVSESFILAQNAGRYERSLEQMPCRFAMDTAGRLVGCITDYAICSETMDIAAVEIMTGYLKREERRCRIWVYDFQRSNCMVRGLTVSI